MESCIAHIIDERFSNNFIVDGVGKYKPYVCVVCDEFLSMRNRVCIPLGQLIDKNIIFRCINGTESVRNYGSNIALRISHMKLMKKHERNYKQWFCHQEHRTLHLWTKGKQKDILSATVVKTICQGMKYCHSL